MSAICGLYYRDEKVNITTAERVMKELGKYRFDVSKTWQDERCFLGCHLNFVAPESIEEINPFDDSESSLVITADAILDNRDELMKRLSLSAKQRGLPDNILILQAYKKWGHDCARELVGDFTFAVWDIKKKELFCARDQVGKRTFYYYHSPKRFGFSTLIKPLFNLDGVETAFNEIYLADFLALPSVGSGIDSSTTMYKDIFQLPPAHSMLLKDQELKIWQYWKIEQKNPIILKNDAEYEEAFREIYVEAVKCRMRSSKKIGVMLSGGLDSGSVACIAAAELKKQGQELYGFTQVPMKGYQDWLPKHKLADERDYVEELCRFSGNIKPHYVASEGKSPLTEINSQIAILEQPYKTFENSYWMNEIVRRAATMDIGVLLDGQSGNATVSWGSFPTYLQDLLKVGAFQTYIQEINHYAQGKQASRARIMANSLVSLLPYEVKKLKHKLRGGKDYIAELSPINKDFYNEMKVKQRFKRHNVDPLFIDHQASFPERKKLLKPSSFAHLGAFETKLAMAHGVVRRDPTRDKRLIEFCVNIPENQWVRAGKERRLIRVAMKGYMPDKVRLNTTVRGQQAADWMQRIGPQWKEVCEELSEIGAFELERRYLDIPKLQHGIAKNRELDLTTGMNSEVRMLIRALIFSRFLRENS
ncbi:MAG: asparagine synthase-related protein [Desulfosporosinus sp.]|nr:asparagine synthase-related protein [Desulfosporosinus sp.]